MLTGPDQVDDHIDTQFPRITGVSAERMKADPGLTLEAAVPDDAERAAMLVQLLIAVGGDLFEDGENGAETARMLAKLPLGRLLLEVRSVAREAVRLPKRSAA